MTDTDPMATASQVWKDLVDWHPAAAAALLRQLRAMPDDWSMRVFGVGRPDAALQLPSLEPDSQAPEIQPYMPDNWEDCPACYVGQCRYHSGYSAAVAELRPRLDGALRIVTDYVIESNDVGGIDCNDLADRLRTAGYDLPGDADD